MSISTRSVVAGLLFVAFAVAQWSAQTHGLSHLRHEMSVARAFAQPLHDHGGHGGHAREHRHEPDDDRNDPEPLDHQADRCLVFHAFDCKATAPAMPPTYIAAFPLPEAWAQSPAPIRAVVLPYHSRAPPAQRS